MNKMTEVSEKIVVATVATIVPMVLRAVARTVFPGRHPLLAAAAACEASKTLGEAFDAASSAKTALDAASPKMGEAYAAGKIAKGWLSAIYANNRPLADTLIGYGDHQWAVYPFARTAVCFAAHAAEPWEPTLAGWRGMEPVACQNLRAARAAVEDCHIVADAAAQAVSVYDPAICFHSGEEWRWEQAIREGTALRTMVVSAFAEITSPWIEFEPAIAAHADIAPLLEEAFR